MTNDDFEPGIPSEERAALERLAARLVADRPLPRPAFRGDLRHRIMAAPRRGALRLRAVAYLVAGTALLAVATLGVTDVGPLAPDLPAGSGPQAHVVIR